MEVQFREFKGEIIAVFPYVVTDRDCVLSYAHIGQHSACIWNINRVSNPVKEIDYRDLLNELKSVYNGITLKVIKRRIHAKYLRSYREYIRKYHN